MTDPIAGSEPSSEDYRFPIGRFVRTEGYTAEQRSEQIATIASLPTLLRNAVKGLTTQQLDTPYRDGGWRVRQVVHHLADSHINGFVRHRLALTEQEPRILAYNESEWSRLSDAEEDITLSLKILDGLHARWASLLRSLSESQLQRTYFHPESGIWTIEQSTANYAWHSLHHVAHITSLRNREGW
jgi:hypothetical protein